MKYTTIITTGALLSGTTNAFLSLQPRATQTTSLAANNKWNAENAKESLNEAKDKIQKQAEKVPEYMDNKRVLLFDANRNKKRLAQNWGWILTEGTLQFAVGMFALLAPTLAISITAVQQSFLLMIIGAVNVFSSLFVEDTFKWRNVLLGGSQVLLGYLLRVDPYDFALITTIGVAASTFVDGSFRAVTALRNQDLPDRGWVLTTGIASVLGSQIIWNHVNEPLAVLGTLLGIKFVSSGASRIRAGLTGQAISNGDR
ncbi:hypothetical protein FisN_14Hh177 [Fistulifera solaris]|uniref:Uncharacterized protein n=1 Tax=Fistulifera solaris TaxID=1519565 RepID=A0A1Z5K8G2_FISSO|nr:hypothetical protein FisN_14Hh177 [Fistulifera solaris]|eukprot:GAX22553.1 hypothetical protein FisN_14Hh177 [Fistulifera solaris]